MLRAVASQPASGTGVAGVSSFNGRSGAVVLGTTDITSAGGAPLNNAGLTGVPTAPTAPANTNTTQLATTAYVVSALAGYGVTVSDTAPASPKPGQLWWDSVGGNLYIWYQDLNTSQWVIANLSPSGSSTVPLMDGIAAVGSGGNWARSDHVHPTDTSRASLASPVFTGAPSLPSGTTGVTQTAGTNNNSLATTAFVTSAGYIPASGGTVSGPLVVTATGASTARSVQDQFGDIVDVKDFGAKGDGSTVDTAAFNAAIATGKTVLVTSGTYIIGPITISQSMIGMGAGSCILRAAPGGNVATDVLITQNAALSAVVRDLTIDGANVCLYGVYCPQANAQQTGLQFERLEVKNFGSTATTISDIAAGIYVQCDETRPASKRAIVVTDCYVHDIYGGGINVSGTGCIASHNTIINVYHAGIAFDLLIDGIVSDNTIDHPGQASVSQGWAADGVTGYNHLNLRTLIANNTIANSANNGIHVGGNDIQIIGNKIYNTTVGVGIALMSDPNASPTPSAGGIISDNLIDTSALSGIRFQQFSRVVIVSNVIISSGLHGIYALVGSDNIIANNIIWTTAGCGVYSDTGVNLQVRGNRINGTTNQAVYDAGASTNMQVSDNIVTSEGTVSNWDRLLTALGSGVANVPGGTLSLTNATSNFEIFGAGQGVPTYTTRSVGTKIVLNSTISPTTVDQAIGIAGGNQWYSIPYNTTANNFVWYGGTGVAAELDGTGTLTLVNNLSVGNNTYAPGGFTVTQSGTYPFQMVVVPGSPSLQELQFQGPSYAITCNGASGNISVLVGSTIATFSPTGLNVVGSYQVGGTKVVGTQITGYGTPTGGVKTANFAGASATLAQTSAQLAQLILDLKTHGLLGA